MDSRVSDAFHLLNSVLEDKENALQDVLLQLDEAKLEIQRLQRQILSYEDIQREQSSQLEKLKAFKQTIIYSLSATDSRVQTTPKITSRLENVVLDDISPVSRVSLSPDSLEDSPLERTGRNSSGTTNKDSTFTLQEIASPLASKRRDYSPKTPLPTLPRIPEEPRSLRDSIPRLDYFESKPSPRPLPSDLAKEFFKNVGTLPLEQQEQVMQIVKQYNSKEISRIRAGLDMKKILSTHSHLHSLFTQMIGL